MLGCLRDKARRRALMRVSLETGSVGALAPARAKYAAAGLVERALFGRYRPNVHSTFMTLDLTGRPASGAPR